MSKKSVLFLCQFFYPEKVSSATLPFDTARGLSDAGFDVGVMCGYPKEYLVGHKEHIAIDESVDGIKIHRLKYRTLSRKNPFSRLINYFSFTFKAFQNIRRIKQYDFVIVYSNPPILPYVAHRAHKKYGTRVIFVSYDVYPEIAINTGSISPNGFISRLMKRINVKVYPELERLVVLSNDMGDFLLHNRNIDPRSIITIPNWFHEIKTDKPYLDTHNGFIVTYLGNIGTCQDVETIINAAIALKENKKIKFIIGGHGNKTEYVKSIILSKDLKNVEFRTFLTGAEYEKVMLSSDCFLLSLVIGIKGLCYPSKYYSYLAYAKPIVSIMEENELTKEISKNNLGYCVKNGDSLNLVQVLETLSKMDKKNYQHICEHINKYFLDNYTTSQCTLKYVDLLDNLCENKRI